MPWPGRPARSALPRSRFVHGGMHELPSGTQRPSRLRVLSRSPRLYRMKPLSQDKLSRSRNMKKPVATRRALLGGLGAGLAGTTLLKSQQDWSHENVRVPAMDELRTVAEFEPVAFAKLPRETW